MRLAARQEDNFARPAGGSEGLVSGG
jgi:hypothetical protein